jgi:hypothetical protein
MQWSGRKQDGVFSKMENIGVSADTGLAEIFDKSTTVYSGQAAD